MRIALGQFTVHRDKSINGRRMEEFAAQAARQDADLILFPESAMADYDADDNLSVVAEPLDGPFVSGLSNAARANGLIVVAGVHEAIPGTDRVYNTVVAIAADGSLLGYYRKIHLFDSFGIKESDQIEPGDGSILRFAVGDIVCGVETCYDIRFPELSRHLADEGAHVILLPAAWFHGLLKESHWEILLRARAIENTVYVAAAGIVGGAYSGSSMLIDPMGVPVVMIGENEGVIAGDVHLERLHQVRKKLPSREHVRPDIYRTWELQAVR
jgi:predicted amidohydrolase